MKKMIAPLGIGMAMGAALMGAYQMMPKNTKNKMKKTLKDFTDDIASVKTK